MSNGGASPEHCPVALAKKIRTILSELAVGSFGFLDKGKCLTGEELERNVDMAEIREMCINAGVIEMLAALDKDGDSDISVDEMVEAMDADGNGKVTLEEFLVALLRASGVSDAKVAAVTAHSNTNNHGKNGIAVSFALNFNSVMDHAHLLKKQKEAEDAIREQKAKRKAKKKADFEKRKSLLGPVEIKKVKQARPRFVSISDTSKKLKLTPGEEAALLAEKLEEERRAAEQALKDENVQLREQVKQIEAQLTERRVLAVAAGYSKKMAMDILPILMEDIRTMDSFPYPTIIEEFDEILGQLKPDPISGCYAFVIGLLLRHELSDDLVLHKIVHPTCLRKMLPHEVDTMAEKKRMGANAKRNLEKDPPMVLRKLTQKKIDAMHDEDRCLLLSTGRLPDSTHNPSVSFDMRAARESQKIWNNEDGASYTVYIHGVHNLQDDEGTADSHHNKPKIRMVYIAAEKRWAAQTFDNFPVREPNDVFTNYGIQRQPKHRRQTFVQALSQVKREQAQRHYRVAFKKVIMF